MAKLNHFIITHYDGGILKKTLNINRQKCTKIQLTAEFRNNSLRKERVDTLVLFYDNDGRELGRSSKSIIISPLSSISHTTYATKPSSIISGLSKGKNSVVLYVNRIKMKSIYFNVR
ncbi:hypothetical protein LNN31_12695 [Acetobacterium wieringae]|uniref:Uncharacterized protein n=1 Tax=Acetobacterium wieringae TaxID=52694 RepID=A0ABY6HB08_9FIRM|nr:hypothetical protein [Acetobacterium wieringae]UYO61638.1 hypothetical protein LNN31_12695 [Acetobacterium wieringae]